MLARLFVLFAVVPLAELAILIHLGRAVGAWPTIGLVLLTGFMGALLARRQGLRVLGAIRTQMSVGAIPAEPLLDGLFILVGGVLLLTPGLITDSAGLLLLLPVTRRPLKRALRARLERMVRSGRAGYTFVVR